MNQRVVAGLFPGIPRRTFLGGVLAGAAGLVFVPDPVIDLVAESRSPGGHYVFGFPGSWNEAPTLGTDTAGNLVAAWVAYRDAQEQIFAVRWEKGLPLPPEPVSAPGLANFEPLIVPDPAGGFWTIWTGLREASWCILGRRHVSGRFAPETPLSPPDHVCFRPCAAVGSSGLWAAWETLSQAGPEVWATTYSSGRWKPATKVGDGSQPSMAIDASGRTWIAWHVAERGRYEIRTSAFLGRSWSEPERISRQDAHLRHPSLATARGGDVWLTCEGFVPTQATRAAERDYQFDDQCSLLPLCECTFRRTGLAWQPGPNDPIERQGLVPTIVCQDNRLWLVYYQRDGDKFRTFASAIEGERWVGDIDILSVAGIGCKLPPAAVDARGTLAVAVQADERIRVNDPAWTYVDAPSRITVCALGEVPTKAVARPSPEPPRAPVYLNPSHAASPRHAIDVNGQTLRVFFGDLHKHSEISTCGAKDGHIDENYSYARDIRYLDFMQSSDHAEHQNLHDWHETRKFASLFNRDGAFVTFLGFEWTSEFQRADNLKTGHYNPTFLTTGDHLRCLSASQKDTNTPKKLWAALRAQLKSGDDVLTVGHHPGRRAAPLDWEYYDPAINPLIEVAQARGSYEYYGCPDAKVRYNDTTRIRGHMVQDGLARGYVFGFIGSGDHNGSALVGVYAPELTRRAIFEALKARRCYGTNGPKIVLDFRVDGHFMGERFDSAPTGHTLTVRALGRSIERIDIWRDGRIVHSEDGGGRDTVDVLYRDAVKPDRRESYYYARVIQADSGIAWSSPVWVQHTSVPPNVVLYVDDKEPETVEVGTVVDLPLVIRNERAMAATVEVQLDVPAGWTAPWRARQVEVKPEWWTEVRAQMTAPGGPYQGTRPVAVRMICDGQEWTSQVRFGVRRRATAVPTT